MLKFSEPQPEAEAEPKAEGEPESEPESAAGDHHHDKGILLQYCSTLASKFTQGTNLMLH